MGDTVLLVINEQKLDALNHGLLSKLYRNLLLILSERLRERVEERKAQ